MGKTSAKLLEKAVPTAVTRPGLTPWPLSLSVAVLEMCHGYSRRPHPVRETDGLASTALSVLVGQAQSSLGIVPFGRSQESFPVTSGLVVPAAS